MTSCQDTDLLIAYNLDLHELALFFQVCKRFNTFSEDKSIWENLLFRKYGQVLNGRQEPRIQLYNLVTIKSYVKAAREGLLYVIERLPRCSPFIVRRMINKAAGRGYFHILSWIESKYVVDYLGCRFADYFSRACYSAAENNRLDVLDWLESRGAPIWRDVLYNACRKGHLEVMEWLYQRGIHPNKKLCILPLKMVILRL